MDSACLRQSRGDEYECEYFCFKIRAAVCGWPSGNVHVGFLFQGRLGGWREVRDEDAEWRFLERIQYIPEGAMNMILQFPYLRYFILYLEGKSDLKDRVWLCEWLSIFLSDLDCQQLT
jgi:hypothetical protein